MPVSYASDGMQCGAPIACQIDRPAQVVHVQACAPIAPQVVAVQQLQAVHQPIMQTVQAVEYRPVKQTVTKPVVTTEYVDQAVTVMTPVNELKTVNVSTVDYQTVTEYKTVKKNVGYWATQNVPTNRVNAFQYDNRPNVLGAMNRASYNMRNAFTPPMQQVRTYVPQTMTCTVPCKKTVAVPGMKAVTYNVTRMQPTQTTRKVAVNKVTYQTAEVTVMAPHQVTKTVHVGTKVSYAHPSQIGTAFAPGVNGGTALAPTPDPNNQKASAKQNKPTQTATPNGNLDSDAFGKGASLEIEDPTGVRLTETSAPTSTFTASAKPVSAPTVVRVSQWVARTPASSHPQPSGKSAAMTIADSAQ